LEWLKNMTVEKSPSMPLYGKDIYTDERVLRLSFAHQGLYVRLLWWQWTEGSIDPDVRVIASVAGREREVRKLWPDLAQFFPIHPTIEGRLANPKLEKIRANLAKIRERRSESGRKGNVARWQDVSQIDRNAVATGSLASAVAVASAFAEEENTIPPRSGGSGGNGEENRDRNRSGWQPVWTQKAFQYRVDKVQDFVKRAKSHDKIGPGDEDFDAAFFGAFSMTWDYWTAQSEAHQAYFGAMARGAA
jgi:hypothetical protein